MATSLLSLSEEPLASIVDRLEYLDHFELAVVCRKLNRLATPHVYANVHLMGASLTTGSRYLIPFTFLMLQRSEMASLVQSFSIRDTIGYEEYLSALKDSGDADQDQDTDMRIGLLSSYSHLNAMLRQDIKEWKTTIGKGRRYSEKSALVTAKMLYSPPTFQASEYAKA